MTQTKKQKLPDLKYMRRHSVRKKDQCAALVVGHYCHDQITLHGGETVYSLGGSVSYITNVFEALGIGSRVSERRVHLSMGFLQANFQPWQLLLELIFYVHFTKMWQYFACR